MNDNRMKIPLFPLEVVLFPGAALPLHIFEDRYREMIGECLARKSAFGVVQAQREGLAVIGCTAEIVSVLNRYPDGRLDILCQGLERFEIENLDNSRSFLQAEVDFFGDDDLPASRALREKCMAMHFEVRELLGARSCERGLRSRPADLLSVGIGGASRFRTSSRSCLACAPTPNARSGCASSTVGCCPSCGVARRPAK